LLNSAARAPLSHRASILRRRRRLPIRVPSHEIADAERAGCPLERRRRVGVEDEFFFFVPRVFLRLALAILGVVPSFKANVGVELKGVSWS
jgi:hypothetical protein